MQKEFGILLRLNGCPQHYIDKTYISTNNTSLPLNNRTLQSTNSKWFYLSTLFISEKFDQKLKRIFKQEGFNIRIVHKSNILLPALRTKRTQNMCKITNCIISYISVVNEKMKYTRSPATNGHRFMSLGSKIRQLHERINKPVSCRNCRMCKSYDESINHIIACCPVLTKDEYIERHSKAAGGFIHWKLICQHYSLPTAEKWYKNQSKTVTENEDVTVLWDMHVHTDKKIKANKAVEIGQNFYNKKK